VTYSGLLKLADFGLAKVYGSPRGCHTSQVFVRWYRPPELLWGSTSYGPAVDIWAMGCVFAELMLRRPWFTAETDIKQLQAIFAELGTPTPEQWEGMSDLPSYIRFSPASGRPLHKIFPQVRSTPRIAHFCTA
jgi:cyclin-dependent kinase 7